MFLVLGLGLLHACLFLPLFLYILMPCFLHQKNAVEPENTKVELNYLETFTIYDPRLFKSDLSLNNYSDDFFKIGIRLFVCIFWHWTCVAKPEWRERMILNIYSLICNCFVSLKAFCDCHFCGITNTINMIFLLLFLWIWWYWNIDLMHWHKYNKVMKTESSLSFYFLNKIKNPYN